MAGLGLEAEMSLSEDVAREFKHVKEGQDRTESHLNQQDRQLSEHFRKFNQHVLDDLAIQGQMEAHLSEHRESKKHRWAIVIGIVLTALSTLGMLAVEIIKHFFMKG